MATKDNDLDDFFKKKDRKGNKHKAKQSGILINNEELLKQLGKRISSKIFSFFYCLY